MINSALKELLNKHDLSKEVTRGVMLDIMDGKAKNSQVGAFLTSMRLKGETIDEITECAKVMREKCESIKPDFDVLDIVGTGGDELNTFNISTVSMFVISAGGVKVAKHGGRSVSSKCGSADLLEALGVNINLNKEQNYKVLNELGLCFMFAPIYHSAMRHVSPIRKELGVRTIFNILGPLANPAGANHQLLGVYDVNLVEPLANVLSNLGVKRAIVVHGQDGLDEVSITGSTVICEVNNGNLNSYFITPEQFGLKRGNLKDLIGGDPKENAEIALSILKGEKSSRRDIVVLNSACCLYMNNENMTLRDAVRLANELIDSKKAYKKLQEFIKLTNKLGSVN